MPDKLGTIALYAIGASLAAATLYYVFGSSMYPEDDESRIYRKPGAVGLSNPANDCFINSTLQALAGLSDLRAYVEKEVGRRESCMAGEMGLRREEEGMKEQDEVIETRIRNSSGRDPRIGVVTLALKIVLEQLNERPRCRKTISAGEFVSSLEYAYGSKVNRRQQDAQEFLQHVAERLCDEHHAASQVRLNGDNSGPHEESTESKADSCFPLEGHTESQIECQTCYFKPKPSVSSFVTLTLNVPNQSHATLDSCLDGLLKQEIIDDYKCDRCRLMNTLGMTRQELDRNPSPARRSQLEQDFSRISEAVDTDPESTLDNIASIGAKAAPKRRITRHVRISTYPKVLAMHLSRSIFDPSSFSTKNTAKVAFPEQLMLGGFDRKAYKLACLVTHRGGHNSGHYETFRRQAQASSEESHGQYTHRRHRNRNKWWRISDDRIAECVTVDVLDMQKEVYLLFYELMERRVT